MLFMVSEKCLGHKYVYEWFLTLWMMFLRLNCDNDDITTAMPCHNSRTNVEIRLKFIKTI